MAQTDGRVDTKVRHRSFSYKTELRWIGESAGELSADRKAPIRVASPPEFHGEEGTWTPEDLFVAALEICTMTTFLALAQQQQLPIEEYESHAEGTLDSLDGVYRFTRVTLRPRIVIADAAAVRQTARALHDAHSGCLISNSVRCEVVVEPVIEVSVIE